MIHLSTYLNIEIFCFDLKVKQEDVIPNHRSVTG